MHCQPQARIQSLLRLEQLAVMLGALLLCVVHRASIDGLRFALAFVLIDVIGYLPGAVAFRRSERGAIRPLYHHLYNLTHNYLSATVVIGLWALLHGGFEAAMLAIPLHLSGDRALFGNLFKPPELPFERPSPGDAP